MKLIIEFEVKKAPNEAEEMYYTFVTDKKLLKFLDKDVVIAVTKSLRQYLLKVKTKQTDKFLF